MPADRLGALLNELSPDDQRALAKRFFTKGALSRTCPSCATTMLRGWIHDHELEYCDMHGVWMSKAALQGLLSQHADLYMERNRDRTPVAYLIAIPVLGPLAMPLDLVVRPFAKRRRLRKYLARTTPPKSQ
jgi:hypothetical protein